MTDYTQVEDYSVKDALVSGDPEKIILGSDIDAELSAIATAIASKFDSTDIGVATTGIPGLDADQNVSAVGARLTSTNDVTLASTDHALQIGASSGINLAVDNNEIQSRNNGSAAALALNALGGNITLGEEAANGNTITLANEQTEVAGGQLSALIIKNTQDGGPAVGGTQVMALRFATSNDDLVGLVGFVTSADMTVRNQNHGGHVLLQAENGSGTVRLLVDADPDGDVELLHQGTSVARTVVAASGGLEVNNTDTGAGFERVLTASDLTSASATTRTKSADETISSDGVPTLDSDLDISSGLSSSTVYAVEVVLQYSQVNSVPDGLEVQSNYTHSSSGDFIANALHLDGITLSLQQIRNNTVINVPDSQGASTRRVLTMTGLLQNATAFGIRWSQNVSNSANTTLHEGSYIKLTPL